MIEFCHKIAFRLLTMTLKGNSLDECHQFLKEHAGRVLRLCVWCILRRATSFSFHVGLECYLAHVCTDGK